MDSSSTESDKQEEEIIQIASDLRTLYSDIGVDIKPTWINLTILLALSTKLGPYSTARLTDANNNSSSGHKTDCRNKQNFQHRPICSHSHDSTGNLELVQNLKECKQSTRMATIIDTDTAPLRKRRKDRLEKEKITPVAEGCLTSHVEKEESSEKEIISIKSNIDHNYQLCEQQQIAEGRRSRRDYKPTNQERRPHSWHVGGAERQPTYSNDEIINTKAKKQARRRSSSLCTFQPKVTDYAAKVMSDSYRLMTATHSRLSSRDGSVTPPPVDELQFRIKKYYQQQPVLGLRQRHRLSSQRRRSALGIERSSETNTSANHCRRHSDSLVTQQHVSTQTDVELPANDSDSVYTHHSDYYKAVENRKVTLTFSAEGNSMSTNHYQSSVDEQILSTNHQIASRQNLTLTNQVVQSENHDSTSTSITVGNHLSAKPDLYPENKQERARRSRKSHEESQYLNGLDAHGQSGYQQITHDMAYEQSHKKSESFYDTRSQLKSQFVDYMRSKFPQWQNKSTTHRRAASLDQHMVPYQRPAGAPSTRPKPHRPTQPHFHARSQSLHSTPLAKNDYQVSRSGRLPMFAPIYFPVSDSVFSPGYVTVSVSGYGSTRSPVYAAIYTPVYDRVDDVIYATVDDSPMYAECGDWIQPPYQNRRSPEEIWRHENTTLYNGADVADSNNNHTSIHSHRGDNITYTPEGSTRVPPPPPRRTKYPIPRYKDLDNEDGSLVNTTATPINASPSRRLPQPAKRTASMPLNMQRPIVSQIYPQPQDRNASGNHAVSASSGSRSSRLVRSYQAPSSDSQRPGRGVFTSSGRKVHEGQRRTRENRPRTNDAPPQLPARNPSTGRNTGEHPNYTTRQSPNRRGVSLDRSINNNGQFPNSWAQRHSGNPDWSYSSSEYSQRPIDQLRDRVRKQQEKDERKASIAVPFSNESTFDTVDGHHHHHYHTGSTKSHPSVNVPGSSVERSRLGQHRQFITKDASRSPSPLKHQHQLSRNNQYPSPNPHIEPESSQQTGTVLFSSRTLSPQRSKNEPVISQRASDNYRAGPTHRNESPTRRSSTNPLQKQQASSQQFVSRSISQPNASSNVPHFSQKNRTVKPRESYEQPKPASNKYKMLVCPDFFPVAKLHSASKRKSKAGDFVAHGEVLPDPPKEYSGNFDEGFYSKRSNQMIPLPHFIQVDDSFVEDPQEQLLYPSTKPANQRKSELQDSDNQCVEISPASGEIGNSTTSSLERGKFTTYSRGPQMALEGDSLFSVDVTGDTMRERLLAKNKDFTTTECSKPPTNPVPPQRAIHVPPSYQQAVHRNHNNSVDNRSYSSIHPKTKEPLQSHIVYSQNGSARHSDMNRLPRQHRGVDSRALSQERARNKDSDSRHSSSKLIPHKEQPQTMAYTRSEPSSKSGNSLPASNSLNTPEIISALGKEHIEYQQANFSGQKGQTATVLASIEPTESEEGSHYSTVHIYRNVSERSAPNTRGSSSSPAHPWEHHGSSSDSANTRHKSADNYVTRNTTSNHGSSTINSFGERETYTNSITHNTLPSDIQHLPFQSQKIQSAPYHRDVLDSTQSNDDQLLERIKAQNSSTSNSSSVSEPFTPSSQPHQSLYQNVEDLVQYSASSVHHAHPTSIASPDYFYPSVFKSEQNPAISSHTQLNKSKNMPVSEQEMLANSQQHMRGSPDHIIPLRHSHNATSLTRNSPDQSLHPKHPRDHSPAPMHSYNQITQGRQSPPHRLTSDSSIELKSQEDGRKFDERQKVVNFVEPLTEWIRSTEQLAENPPIEEITHSTEFIYHRHGESSRNTVDNEDSQSEEATPEDENNPTEHEMTRLMQHLEEEKAPTGSSKGLGEDILSITKMWKNLPTKDSWDDKRKVLLDDPIMTSISEKMEAILKSSGADVERSERPRTLTVKNQVITPEHLSPVYSQVSPQSINEVGLVTREPGEGSSDDLDESIDLKFRKLRHKQLIQSHSVMQEKTTVKSMRSSIPVSHARIATAQSALSMKGKSHLGTNQSPSPKQTATSAINQSNATSKRNGKDSSMTHTMEYSGMVKAKQVTLPDADSDQEDLFKVTKSSPGSDVPRKKVEKASTSTQELSDSEESIGDDDEDLNAVDSSTNFKQEETDDSEDDLPESNDVRYLSDYHRGKARSKQRAQSKKKISFSTDSKRSRPGDLISPGQSETLLSVNPFMTSSSLPLEKSSSTNLLSVNPFLVEEEKITPESETDSVNKGKPRHGILKRSEDAAGSQLSLGTCSEFGSHISLASGQSGISRAGSFPLLTMSDGSKKDFKITFNDTDTSDMGNLFKVTRKARSEGAASEPESTDSESDDDAMPVMCKNCLANQPLFKARLVYKMCHGCYTYYCSSECRRQDWTAHKPLCIVSRLSSLARKIFKCVMTDQELLHHCSRFARTGYLCEGRGAVVLSFASPRKAQLFLSNAKQAKESALYLCVKDLQKFTFDDKRDKEQLLANCKHYNPDDKFVLHLAIKMSRGMSPQSVEPRIRGREFHKWARIRLSDRHNVPKGDRYSEEDTLLLTAISGTPDQSTQEVADPRAREVFFATVLTKLRKRGISLRHQYPHVYDALCHYVTSGKPFVPISLFAFNLHTQKRFMCCIMPYSDPDVTWGNNPHLMEDLDLAVTF